MASHLRKFAVVSKKLGRLWLKDPLMNLVVVMIVNSLITVQFII